MRRSALGLTVVLTLVTALPVHAAKIQVTWDPNPETIAGYRLYYGNNPTPPFNGNLAAEGSSPVDIPIENLDDPDNPAFALTGVPYCHMLYFALTAYDADANESDFSNTVSAMVVAKPTEVKASPVGFGAVEVSWAGIAAEDQMRLNRVRVHYGSAPGDYTGTDASQGASPVGVPPVSSSAVLTGLEPGQEIYVMVEAVCPTGDGARSDEIKVNAGTEGEPPSQVLQVGCAMAPGGTAGPLLLCPLGLLLLIIRRRRRGC